MLHYPPSARPPRRAPFQEDFMTPNWRLAEARRSSTSSVVSLEVDTMGGVWHKIVTHYKLYFMQNFYFFGIGFQRVDIAKTHLSTEYFQNSFARVRVNREGGRDGESHFLNTFRPAAGV